MLINSPRAKLPLGDAMGAAFWMRREICGACAAARPAIAGTITVTKIRVVTATNLLDPDMLRGVLAFLASSICA